MGNFFFLENIQNVISWKKPCVKNMNDVKKKTGIELKEDICSEYNYQAIHKMYKN